MVPNARPHANGPAFAFDFDMMDLEGLDPSVHGLKATLDGLQEDSIREDGKLEDRLNWLLGQMPRFPGHFLYVFDYRAGRLTYHRGFDEVLGYHSDEVGFELLYRAMHPEDAPVIARLSEATIREMDRIRNPKDLFEMTLSVDYRIRKKSGKYIKVLRQTAVFEVDQQSGKVISTFSLCKDISAIKKSATIGWQIHGGAMSRVDLRGVLQYMNRMHYHPSPREMDILGLMCEGKPSKQIAAELGLSTLTVNTHRANLLKRTGLKNTAELITHAVQEGWV
jgi:DNA-binding CsgD family transcriptional regulator/PAS domain-containing protein